MIWRGTGELVSMGGYGLYVWGSVGMVLIGLVCEWFALALRRRAALRQVSSFHAGDEPDMGTVE